MIILSASDICKSYGTEVILENISFHINAGDRVGIVGANGAGKSTLLNIISGQMKADSGNCFVGKDTTIGYLRQRDNFDDDLTVIEEVNNIFTDMVAMEEEILHLNEEIAKETNPDAAKPLWNRLNALQHEFEIKGGYTYKSEISGVLTSMLLVKNIIIKVLARFLAVREQGLRLHVFCLESLIYFFSMSQQTT